MVSALARAGLVKEAEAAIRPMVSRVLQHNGFWEWWAFDGSPQGSDKFHGSAGMCMRVHAFVCMHANECCVSCVCARVRLCGRAYALCAQASKSHVGWCSAFMYVHFRITCNLFFFFFFSSLSSFLHTKACWVRRLRIWRLLAPSSIAKRMLRRPSISGSKALAEAEQDTCKQLAARVACVRVPSFCHFVHISFCMILVHSLRFVLCIFFSFPHP